MSSGPTGLQMADRVRVRNPFSARYAPVAAVGLIVGAVLSGGSARSWIFGVGAACVLFMVFWPRLSLTEHGPIVVNLFARRVLWRDIRNVDFKVGIGGISLILETTDGKRIKPWAAAARHEQYDWFMATYRTVHLRWQEANGTPGSGHH